MRYAYRSIVPEFAPPLVFVYTMVPLVQFSGIFCPFLRRSLCWLSVWLPIFLWPCMLLLVLHRCHVIFLFSTFRSSASTYWSVYSRLIHFSICGSSWTSSVRFARSEFFAHLYSIFPHSKSCICSLSSTPILFLL